LHDAEELDTVFADIMRKAAAGEFDVEGGTLAEVAESATTQAGGPHDELLEKYQVAPDPDGMTEWSPKWVGWLPGVPDTRPTGSDLPWPTDNPERGEHREPGEPDAYPERGY